MFFSPRLELVAENLALRQQLAVLSRTAISSLSQLPPSVTFTASLFCYTADDKSFIST
jgi:hypothetical protein